MNHCLITSDILVLFILVVLITTHFLEPTSNDRKLRLACFSCSITIIISIIFFGDSLFTHIKMVLSTRTQTSHDDSNHQQVQQQQTVGKSHVEREVEHHKEGRVGDMSSAFRRFPLDTLYHDIKHHQNQIACKEKELTIDTMPKPSARTISSVELEGDGEASFSSSSSLPSSSSTNNNSSLLSSSSSTSADYFDEQSTVYSPIPTPMGVVKKVVTDESPTTLLSPSLSFGLSSKQNEVIQNNNGTNDNYDVSSMDDDHEKGNDDDHDNEDDEIATNTSRNSTINTNEERYDYRNSVRTYYQEVDTYENDDDEEENREITKQRSTCALKASNRYHSHQYSLNDFDTDYNRSIANNDTRERYNSAAVGSVGSDVVADDSFQSIESPICHPNTKKADYIQELYRKVVAANHGNDGEDMVIPATYYPNQYPSSGVGGSRKDNGWIPKWVIETTPMIKFVIVLSTALLIGSAALIVIAVAVSMHSNWVNSSQQSGFSDFTNAPSPTIFVITNGEDTNDGSPSTQPSNAPYGQFSTLYLSPTPSSKSLDAFLTPTIATTFTPSISTSSRPSGKKSSNPSPSPSVNVSESPSVASSITSFYITSRNRQRSMQSQLALLRNNNNEWLIHLGNWNRHSQEVNRCESHLYDKIVDIYKNSTVPVFFVPGDNEWNDCDNYPDTINTWRNHFVDFEQNWSPLPFEVVRHKKQIENFSFMHKKVLYIGLNMVGGIVHNASEWTNRMDDNIEWVANRVNQHMKEVEVVMVFGNSGNIKENEDFFIDLAILIEEWNTEYFDAVKSKLHFFYIKESENEFALNQNFMGQDNFLLVNIQEGTWPVGRITIDTSMKQFTYNDDGEWGE